MCAKQCMPKAVALCGQGKALLRSQKRLAGSSPHRAAPRSMLSRQQIAPADSPVTVHVGADATAEAQSHAASGIQSPFQRQQTSEPCSEAFAARPSSGRLFPDTAKGHMAMVCCFTAHSINVSWSSSMIEQACSIWPVLFVNATFLSILLVMMHTCQGVPCQCR